MLSPNPLSLLCAVVLSLPLAVVFTFSGNPSSSSVKTPPVSLPIPTSTIHTTNNSLNITQTQHKNSKSQNRRTPADLPSPFLSESDESLLRAASRASAKPTTPRKVAFMFLTTTPLPFASLWESFFRPAPPDRFNVYVHADPTGNYTPPFSGVFSRRVIPSSSPTRRNTPSLASAARRLLAHALLHDHGNAVFVLLSASCIPLRAFEFTYRKLVRSRKSFIEILRNETTAYDRWAARGEDAMVPEVALDNFRIGSQFWALTRRHARVVVRDVRLWGKFGLPCVREDTCYPEENYFPTVLSMVDPRGVVPATLTHVDWKGREDGHPRTYNASEVGTELIRRLRMERPRYGEVGMINGSDVFASRWDPFLFARKFGPECVGPLMSIADEAIFNQGGLV